MLNFRISPVSFCSAGYRRSSDDVDTSRRGSNTYYTKEGASNTIPNEVMRRIKHRHPDNYKQLLNNLNENSQNIARQVEKATKKIRRI